MVHIATDVINKPELAIQYLEDMIYDCLLNRGEPLRTSEIMECFGSDLPVTPKLVRRVMSASDRFSAVDRRWDIAVKFMDIGVPVQRLLQDVLDSAGKTVSPTALAVVMAAILGRTVEGTTELVQRMIRAKDRFFVTEKGNVGNRDWLLDISFGNDEDVRFQNFESEAELDWALKLAERVKWDPADLVKSSADFLKLADRPVTNKTISYLCWRAAGSSFDPVRYFSKMEADARVLLFSGALWANKGLRVEFVSLIKEAADAAEELPAEVEISAEEATAIAPAAPPEVTPEDLDRIYERMSSKEGSIRLPVLVEDVFELSPGERGYAEAADVLHAAMDADERFLWVGTDRWRLAGSIPEYVTELPEMLLVPTLVFETPEGERLDLELEDEGLEGGLADDIENPLVRDVPVEFDNRIKYVLTYPHFHSGTMPTVGEFFPREPAMVEITLLDQQQNRYENWVNNGLGLLFGLESWFENVDIPVSGAIIHVDKTDKPDEFLLTYAGENDPLVYIPPERILELEQIGEEAGEDWSTFDIIRALMEDYKKGVQFITLFTEMNIVRRTSPRLVASILSSFHCFYQKQAGTSVWVYDERKLSQGFKKTKRKYIRK